MPVRRLAGRLALLLTSVATTLVVTEQVLQRTELGLPYRMFADRDEYLATMEKTGRKLEGQHPTGCYYRLPISTGVMMQVRNRFSRPKPAGVFRIFTFGGSTTQGTPITLAAGPDHDLSYSGWLRQRLQRVLPDQQIEIINTGVGGVPLERVIDYAVECLDYEPDLYLIYSGHNEFRAQSLLAARTRCRSPWALSAGCGLLHTRLGRLWQNFLISMTERRHPDLGSKDYLVSERMIEPPMLSLEEEQQVVTSYEQWLRFLAQRCRQRQIPLFVCTLVCNLSDFEPSRSCLRTPLEPAEIEQLEQDIAACQALLQEGLVEPALAKLDALPAAAEELAEVHFRRGKAYQALDEDVLARQCFLRSLDLDGIQQRAPSTLSDAVRRVAATPGVHLIDIDAKFHKELGGRVPGNELFFDNCHPNFEGTRWLVDEMESRLLASRVLPGTLVPARSPQDLQKELNSLGFDPPLATYMYAEMGRAYASQLLFRSYDPGARLQVARQLFQKVFDVDPHNRAYHTLLGCIEIIAGDQDAAEERFARYQPDQQALRNYLGRFLARAKSGTIRRIFRDAGYEPVEE